VVPVTRERNPLTVYLTAEEKQQLEQWADETGKSLSQLGREAITEYTDRDRVERVESEMRAMQDKLDRVLTLVDGEHTRTSGPDRTTSVPEKAREIARTIYENHDMPVKAADVGLVIENVAGGDDRTVEQYKSQLKKRGLLYEHPKSAVWTDDKEQFISWVEGAYYNPDVHDVTQEYGMSVTEYTQLAEELEQ
jgi:hypothetical protein